MYRSIQLIIMIFCCANKIESLIDCPEMTPMEDFDMEKVII